MQKPVDLTIQINAYMEFFHFRVIYYGSICNEAYIKGEKEKEYILEQPLEPKAEKYWYTVGTDIAIGNDN